VDPFPKWDGSATEILWLRPHGKGAYASLLACSEDMLIVLNSEQAGLSRPAEARRKGAS